MTANGCPATTADPLRSGPDVAPTENANEAGPVPSLWANTIHGTLLDAVQGHPAAVSIWIAPLLPAEGAL